MPEKGAPARPARSGSKAAALQNNAALAAALISARRASQISPAEAQRAE
jgi:hypothetical protein